MHHSLSFSVIVPLYNKEPYIERALKSAFSQDFQEFEVIVVDDGSTDGSVRRISEAFGGGERLRVIEQPNAGQGAARNRGIKEMRGAVAAFLDADDEWLPNHLAQIAELASRFPQAGWFATGYRSVSPKRFMIETTLCSPQPLLVEDYFQVCTGAYLVHSSAVAVKKSVLDATGGYLVGEPVGEDLEFYARLALKCPLAYQPMISAVYYCMIPNSALSVARWRCKRPPVVQTLDSYQDVPLSPAMRDSVRRYADWVLSGHVLAGLCAGYGCKATELFGGRRGSSRFLMALIALIVPLPVLNLVVRLRNSRWFVGYKKRHQQVIVRNLHCPTDCGSVLSTLGR